ncbi:lamin tail domain-containing protein [Paucibacter sp. TC2R-5]|uniref:lamin tail domain-containing protein n=1 Tax=Paucibacter sp. TC2R-5 TaxID=2893555 RepID=UPI0021E375F4|nr:lamin tail domain-containing protein [Paucibacter sp. TC2R-5]MCV2360346.1 lamin tail domain-containing protein [Paucibacter sp. TC2R-5]
MEGKRCVRALGSARKRSQARVSSTAFLPFWNSHEIENHCRPFGRRVCCSGRFASSNVVISQVYGGGGNSGATLKNDFIELFNCSDAPVRLKGWSVQYAAAGASAGFSSITVLPDVILQPGQYFLVQESKGAGGTVDLPTPDKVGSIAMSGSFGKVVLASTTSAVASATAPAM